MIQAMQRREARSEQALKVAHSGSLLFPYPYRIWAVYFVLRQPSASLPGSVLGLPLTDVKDSARQDSRPFRFHNIPVIGEKLGVVRDDVENFVLIKFWEVNIARASQKNHIHERDTS